MPSRFAGAEPDAAPIVVREGHRPRGAGASTRPGRFARAPRRRLRIALLAPPWIPVPPPGYGGIELVIALLAGGLVRQGHDVSLLAPPGSESCADVVPVLAQTHDDEIGDALIDVHHVRRALSIIDASARKGRPYDIVHDHSGLTLVGAADRVDVPVLHTLPGPFDDTNRAFYEEHAGKVWVSAL